MADPPGIVEREIARLRAERDALLAALRGLCDVIAEDGHGFHDGTALGRAFGRGRRALAKCKKRGKESSDD